MKKVFVLLLSLLLGVGAFAEGLSKQEALRYAQQFFSDTPSAQLNITWTGNDDQAPAFYVINRAGGGFLVLSAEAAVNPVLGYSYEGSFPTKDMPDNVRAWFGGLENYIKEIRTLAPVPEKDVEEQWQTLGVRTKAEGKVEHETAKWDQGSPYNKLCPTINGRKSVTGCVATAMAITMRYNKFPAHGYGTLNGYITSSQRYHIEGFSIEDHVYNWDLMPMTVSRGTTEEEKDQIAQLMYDCGVAIQMDYSPSGSGAISMYMPAQLAEHFGYSAEAMLFRKSMYKHKEWMNLLRKELDANRVIFYSAQADDGSGGHAFVIDGYDNNDMVRVNWGWGGSANGFFTIDLEVAGLRFNKSNGAVLGLVPDPNHEKEPLTNLGLTSTGLYLVSGKIEAGKSFTVGFNAITNYGNGTFSGPVKVVLADEDDNIKASLSSPLNIEIGALSSIAGQVQDCKLEQATEFKDRIVLAAKDPQTGEYKVIRADVENESVGGLATVPNFIAGKRSYSAGETFEFKLFKSGERFTAAKWYYDGQEVDKTVDSVVLTAGTHRVMVVLTKGNGGTEYLVRELDVK